MHDGSNAMKMEKVLLTRKSVKKITILILTGLKRSKFKLEEIPAREHAMTALQVNSSWVLPPGHPSHGHPPPGYLPSAYPPPDYPLPAYPACVHPPPGYPACVVPTTTSPPRTLPECSFDPEKPDPVENARRAAHIQENGHILRTFTDEGDILVDGGYPVS
uniref:Uncharacterized protein n=1 Tax=Ditylenchus dipsaci TaxID=166011 RepID=A0A915CKT9_9BILA